MSKNYRLSEPYKRINEYCGCCNNEISGILRLLAGTVSIENEMNGEIYVIDECFLSMLSAYKRNDRANRVFLAIADEIILEDYKKFLRIALRSNRGFYTTLNDEFMASILFAQKGNYTSAFLHVYRTLEHISYAFPLLYISKAKDFKKTYGYFKSYFDAQNGEKKGELSFFQAFVKLALVDEPILQTEVVINLSGESEHQRKHYQILKRNIDTTAICSNTVENEKLCLKWDSIPSLIVNLRNRYFHYTNSNNCNISFNEIIDPDQFFKDIYKQCVEWEATLFSIVLNEISQNII